LPLQGYQWGGDVPLQGRCEARRVAVKVFVIGHTGGMDAQDEDCRSDEGGQARQAGSDRRVRSGGAADDCSHRMADTPMTPASAEDGSKAYRHTARLTGK
jgi:hypothetical protein